MIIRARAPLRLGLAGGGTDVAPYCDLHGGCVMNAAIDKYAYATVDAGSDGLVVFEALDRGARVAVAPAELDANAGPVQLLAGAYLRIAIAGGGCNGLSYKLRFTPELRRGDILVRTAGVPVAVDPKTALYLKGTVLDYSSKLVAGGFKFSNPNAKASCSCGESFSV